MLPTFLFAHTAALGPRLAGCPALGRVSEVMAQNLPLCWSAVRRGLSRADEGLSKPKQLTAQLEVQHTPP